MPKATAPDLQSHLYGTGANPSVSFGCNLHRATAEQAQKERNRAVRLRFGEFDITSDGLPFVLAIPVSTVFK